MEFATSVTVGSTPTSVDPGDIGRPGPPTLAKAHNARGGRLAEQGKIVGRDRLLLGVSSKIPALLNTILAWVRDA